MKKKTIHSQEELSLFSLYIVMMRTEMNSLANSAGLIANNDRWKVRSDIRCSVKRTNSTSHLA